jgi:hypothetical protein
MNDEYKIIEYWGVPIQTPRLHHVGQTLPHLYYNRNCLIMFAPYMFGKT